MAAQNICSFNKYGFCKFTDKCRNYHEKNLCENLNCEVRKCLLRHPKICKFFRDFGYCKFGEWCFFKHKENKTVNDAFEKDLTEKMKTIETDLGRPSFRKTQLNLDFSKQGGAGGLGDHPIQILTM